jgi:flagellum-specific peptidoglycan hydrolase FlgJ
MRLRKVLKLSLVIGLLIILFLTSQLKAGMGLKSKGLIWLSKYRALLPYIEAQAKHETGNFTSAVYRNNNNMFGMKNGSIMSAWEMVGTVAPDGGTYAKYACDLDSVKDLLQWFEWKKFPVSVASVEQYASELKSRGYYGDSLANYTNGLKRFLS